MITEAVILGEQDFPYYRNGDPIYQYKLMIKQHYETGISYLCITKNKDYISYKGSGSRWKKLLNKIPSEIITLLLYTTDDKDDLAIAATYQSILYNIPENKNFANLLPECGYEYNQGNLGEWIKTTSPEMLKDIRHRQSKTLKENHRHKKENGIPFGFDIPNQLLYENTGLTNYMHIPEIANKANQNRIKSMQEKYGVVNSIHIPGVVNKIKLASQKTLQEKYNVNHIMQIPEVCAKARQSAIDTMQHRYGVINISQRTGWKEDVGPKISEAHKNRPMVECKHCKSLFKNIILHEEYCKQNPLRKQQSMYECIYCKKAVRGYANLVRWHGDNCKFKDVK